MSNNSLRGPSSEEFWTIIFLYLYDTLPHLNWLCTTSLHATHLSHFIPLIVAEESLCSTFSSPSSSPPLPSQYQYCFSIFLPSHPLTTPLFSSSVLIILTTSFPKRVPLCYLMLEGRKDPSKVGLMYLCTFTLLKLSGERVFGVSLNQPYQLTLPVDVPPFTG